jgi:hypothetical protein
MKTITTQAEIAADGTLRLELATDLSPGPAELVIVVQPTAPRQTPAGRRLSGKYARFSRTELDAVAEVREIRRQATQDAQELPEWPTSPGHTLVDPSTVWA